MSLDPAALERAVAAVPGVESVQVDLTAETPARPGALPVLQLTLAPGADEVAVATAVDRLVREQFGVGVDPARVGVVEESEPEPGLRVVPPEASGPTTAGGLPEGLVDAVVDVVPEADPAAEAEDAADLGALTPTVAQPGHGPHPSRLVIRRLQVSASGLGVAVAVTLGAPRGDVVGRAEGPTTVGGVHRAVAAATAEAVREAVAGAWRGTSREGSPVRVDVDALDVPALGAGRVVVVQLTVTTVAGSERLTGASEVRDDVRQAVVRATLDAVNRRLEDLLDEEGSSW